MLMASNMPVPVSPSVAPGFSGGPSGSPVMLMIPPVACAIMSSEVVLVGSAGAEALHLRVDDARIDGAHHVIAEPQPLNGAGREILHHDIGALRHVLDEIEATLG